VALLHPEFTRPAVAVEDHPWAPLQRPARLRTLFLVSAHNALSQRAQVELRELGHEVTVAVVESAAAMEAAVDEHQPELIVCPFLKTMIPESIWAEHRCLIVHPGPPGDRGPSSLDWAIELESERWGVTVLEASGEAEGGVLATRDFETRDVCKSSLYRHEVRHAAIEALVEAMSRLARPEGLHEFPRERLAPTTGCPRPLMRQDARAIDWTRDTTDMVLRKIRAGDGHPGVLDTIMGTEFHLFGAHRERVLWGDRGQIVAQRHGAICRATIDGAVWITHLKRPDTAGAPYFKLPAVQALQLAGCPLDGVPEAEVPPSAALQPGSTWREILYEEHDQVGYLHFDFHNGAMSTDQCRRLRDAFCEARACRSTKVIVLMGGEDYFSNGIHLKLIEASHNPGLESWRNLKAIDDLVYEIINTDSHLVISALSGDAAAGGVPLAAAADRVVAREDVVLNPYYRHMGGVYGSEYWTYLLPRRVGADVAQRLTSPPFTVLGAREAVRLGLIDAAYGESLGQFREQTRRIAARIAVDPELPGELERKRARRERDEASKPLAEYRAQEMDRSYRCFFGPDRSYHEARRRFVYKLAPCQVPVQLEPDHQLRDPRSRAEARLRKATHNYEQRVLGWYAMGREADAARARAGIITHRRALDCELGREVSESHLGCGGAAISSP
jgi:putative two-component system hydrogenase maturation factor HypX/HoxX